MIFTKYHAISDDVHKYTHYDYITNIKLLKTYIRPQGILTLAIYMSLQVTNNLQNHLKCVRT